jgi:14-3-3 protein beta/theta/zeta
MKRSFFQIFLPFMTLDEYQQAIKKAHCYDIAERYEDMAEEMTKAVNILAREGKELFVATRNSFSLAFKNLVSSRRSSWRVLFAEKQKAEEKQPEDLYIIDEILKKVENELLGYCDKVLQIIDKDILPGIEKCSLTHNVFFLKMKGDYYRYKAEILTGDLEKEASQKALESYTEAKKQADGLNLTDPIRLGLYLNFSVFQYEILDNTDEACKIARTAFDTAISELDTLSEDYYKDSTLIMQLLRDNLTLWTSRNDDLPVKDDNTELS